ncbi:hypothetical protein P8C59_003016 [Phyllachora maydis]|uniref:Uncharacterized protein n=1 Tax=Phyllachora maydis TaxID=1825666 RepID=A0AAD9HZK4_9PEZI|nr:hypothetical protein P8C59_003016 [Phyllachora maydis]
MGGIMQELTRQRPRIQQHSDTHELIHLGENNGHVASTVITHDKLGSNRPVKPADGRGRPLATPAAEAADGQKRPPNKLRRKCSFSPGRRDSIRVGRQPCTPYTAGASAHALDQAPTLHNKRDGDPLARKKPSKKRRTTTDRRRESVIKAMSMSTSSFVPRRPPAEDWLAGRPRDSGRACFRGSARPEWDKENPSSDLSLPTTTQSSMSSASEPITWRLSALEALAPRPTLHYATNPRGGSSPARRSAPSRKLSAPIPESTLRAHKRVDDLANDLSACDLRELMERDQRRRERTLLRDQEKMQRRLARQAEKQRLAAARGEDAPNLERGVLGREAVGLGIDPTSAVVITSRPPLSPSPVQLGKRPEEAGPDTRPLDATRRMDMETALAQAPIAATRPRSRLFKKSRSSDLRTATSDTSRKASESGSSKGLSWASLFRWSGKYKRSSAAGPSSFSNTSRDSMQAPAPPANVTPRIISAGVPKRTRSRFREDLPELPTSRTDEAGTHPTPLPQGDKDASDHAVPSPTHREETSPAPHSISLASIDSEGSWLSGGARSKRRSSGILGSPRAHSPGDHATAEPPVGRFAPAPAPAPAQAPPSSDVDKDEARWGSVRGHQPTVVHKHTVDRMKSYEGILKAFGEEEGEGERERERELEEAAAADGNVQRTTRVKLDRDARPIAAGSAKLMSITPRSSLDAKRNLEPRA